jgi:hypothetical protein
MAERSIAPLRKRVARQAFTADCDLPQRREGLRRRRREKVTRASIRCRLVVSMSHGSGPRISTFPPRNSAGRSSCNATSKLIVEDCRTVSFAVI